MEKATRIYRMKALAGSPTSNVDSFDTAGPPYVEPDSMIVGLVGTVDSEGGNTSPKGEGWFLCDFYLWKHVLRGMGHSQQWVTSLEPAQLVQKYASGYREVNGEPVSWENYAYGHAGDERVVVLDEETLPFAEKELIVYEAKSLRRKYLELLDSTFAEAQKKKRPVVLLMFSHGDIDNSDCPGGLIIGFSSDDAGQADPSDFLTATDVATVHEKYPDVRLTLFMTSCFSGNWVCTPYFQGKEHITVMAATQPEQESWSWNSSASMRHGGSKFSSALVEEVKLESTTAPEARLAREYGAVVEDVAYGMDGLLNPSEVKLGLGALPMFTPAAAHEKFWKCTGYGLGVYADNYNRLTKIPASTGESDVALTAGRAPIEHRSAAYGQTNNRISLAVAALVHKYESSMPTRLPSDESVAVELREFRAGILTSEGLRKLQGTLTFRLGKCALAMHIVKRLDLWKGAATPIFEWNPHRSDDERYRQRIWRIASALHQHTSFFKPSKMGDGKSYEKPYWYLAHALDMHGFSDTEAVLQQIEKAKTILREEAAPGSKRARGDKSWDVAMLEHRTGSFRLAGSPKKKAKHPDWAGIFAKEPEEGTEENKEN